MTDIRPFLAICDKGWASKTPKEMVINLASDENKKAGQPTHLLTVRHLGLIYPGYQRFMKQLLKISLMKSLKKKTKVKNHFVSKKVKGYSQNCCLINLSFLAFCVANRPSTHSKKSQFTVVMKHQSGVPGGSQSQTLRLFKALKNTSSYQMCRQ